MSRDSYENRVNPTNSSGGWTGNRVNPNNEGASDRAKDTSNAASSSGGWTENRARDTSNTASSSGGWTENRARDTSNTASSSGGWTGKTRVNPSNEGASDRSRDRSNAANSSGGWNAETESQKPPAKPSGGWKTSRVNPSNSNSNCWSNRGEGSNKGLPSNPSSVARSNKGLPSDPSSEPPTNQGLPSDTSSVARSSNELAASIRSALSGSNANTGLPSFNKKLHDHINFLDAFYLKTELPESWSIDRTDGAHVKHARFEECKTNAINFAVAKLNSLKEEERRMQLAESDDDDDDDDDRVNPNDGDCDSVYSERSRPFDDVVPQYISSYMSEQCLRQALTIILERNMVWDIGLQMHSFRDMNPAQQLTRLTSRCYCPCGKMHGEWLRQNGVNEIMIPKNKLCHKNHFENITAFIGHMSAKALSDDLIHVGLWNFLHELYPLYTKTKKRKVRTFHLPVVEIHLYDMNIFEVER